VLKISGSILLGLLFFSAFAVLSCNEPAHSGTYTFHTPVEYHDFIVDQQNTIIRQMLKLNELYDSGSEQTIRSRFDSLQGSSNLCLNNIRSLSPYENDSTLKRDALALFQFYDTVFKAEYPRMLQIFLKGEQANERELEELNSIVNKVGLREKVLQDNLIRSQTKFAGEHQFEFSPDGL
jgi:hypothetical protein